MKKEGEFVKRLEALIKKEGKYIDAEGNLLKSEIINSADKMEPALIELLASDTDIKNFFFKKIRDFWVFDVNKFIDYISDKNVFGDDYTKFTQKVSLSVGNLPIKERDEVVLTWPFKDCVLEGGMTKEDETNVKEKFYNEILAKDEIDRLLDEKVLTNFKRYSIKGEVKFSGVTRKGLGTIKDNLIIKGNNLLVLHTLRKQFAGKVKLIYIDPPYNTEKDSFAYNDKFTHSTWLTFMKNRLEIAKELLSDDGTILVQLDWHESHYCKILLDEIFGRDKLINEIVWCYTGPGSPLMRQFNRKHDTILWYRKGDSWTFNGNDIRVPLAGGLGGGWAGLDKKLRKEYAERGKIPEDWWESFPKKQDFLEEFSRIWDQYADIQDKDWLEYAVAARLRADGEKRTGYLTEKPYKLIERLIKTASNEGDIVLDFFAGAGTTGFVAGYLKRQFILVEQLEDTQKVLQNRFNKTDHIYFELLKANQEFMEKINRAKTSKELSKIWEEMKESSFISYKLNIKEFDESKEDFEELSLENQKKFLKVALDKNQLYINLSEIDDKNTIISEEDRKLNKDFYKDE